MTDYKAFLRRRMLEDIYDRMSDDEKKLFIQLAMQDKSSEEILTALQRQNEDIQAIRKNQNWLVDFGSDVTANLFTDSLIWIGSRILKK